MSNTNNSPKIFISYSWSSSDHEKWVEELVEKLFADGIHVIFDKYDLKEGQDKYEFMEKMVTDETIQKVLMVCDNEYSKKANNRKGGVGTESQIISSEIYDKVDQEKFIPIVRELDKSGNPCLPVFLNSRIYIDFSDDDVFYDSYEKLVRNIFNKPLKERPKLGAPPSYITDDKPILLRSNHKFAAFKDALLNEKKITSGIAKEYIELILKICEEDFILDKNSTNDKEIDEIILEKIRDFKPYRDELIEFVELICNYNPNASDLFQHIFDFLQKYLAFISLRPSTYAEHNYDHYKFFIYEFFLYLITIFIKNNNLSALDLFLSNRYFFYNSIHNSYSDCSFCRFYPYLQSLDKHRKTRLQLNKISITADLIKERADRHKYQFKDIMQTDLILFIRSLNDNWYPRTLIYCNSSPFEIFYKARFKDHFDNLKKILKISKKEDLNKSIGELNRFFRNDFEQIINYNKLGTA